MMCGTILAAMAFAASFAESVRKQRSYDDMTWGDPYVENISDREGDAPHGTRILQGFPRFQPSECPWNRVETPRSGCFRAGCEIGVANLPRWSREEGVANGFKTLQSRSYFAMFGILLKRYFR